jgi:hypothetical protein
MVANLSIYVILKFALDHAWLLLPVLVGYALGFWHGHDVGRVKENRLWTNEVTPVLKRLECERDALWRSAVSKKQKLNRLMKQMGRL